MKKITSTFIFSMAIVFAFSQRPSGTPNVLTTQQFQNIFFPTLNRVASIDCNVNYTLQGCNYIQNYEFNLSGNPINTMTPFVSGNVPFWASGNGNPIVPNAFYGIASSPATPNFAAMGLNFNNNTPIGSSIVQKIPTLQNGNEYLLNFFEIHPAYFVLAGTGLSEVNIYLIKCVDYLNFNSTLNTYPIVPTASQQIFCETGLLSVFPFSSPGNWTNVSLKFVANDNYDMIWIVPKSNISNQRLIYCFAAPELINVSAMQIVKTPAIPSPGNCLMTLSVSNLCTVFNSQIKWTGPNGQILLGSQIQVDTNNPNNVGDWTFTISNPLAVSTNSTCSNNNGTITLTTNVPSCVAPCINLPLIK